MIPDEGIFRRNDGRQLGRPILLVRPASSLSEFFPRPAGLTTTGLQDGGSGSPPDAADLVHKPPAAFLDQAGRSAVTSNT